MIQLSKKEFLISYTEITEQEYENTKDEILHFVRSRKQLYKELKQNIKNLTEGKHPPFFVLKQQIAVKWQANRKCRRLWAK